MPTTTNVEKVKLNLMTTAQYTAATKDPNQLYMVTDAQISYNDLSNKPNLATVATTGSYNDLSNKPTIPTVNNATLTIQKNGTTVKTFTANASSNVTCNITVPTDTSDLTNGAGYTTNVGTVTSVNNVSPVNGNVTLSIPSEVTETTVSGWGFTKNAGTVTSVNNVSPVNGNVTLRIPSIDNLANKDLSNLSTTGNSKFQEPLVSGTNIKTINNTTILGSGNISIESLPSQSGQGGKYLTTNGTTASWGVPKTFDLLDWKWSDHELSDQSWLNADTFSWQNGTTYSDVYNHLVDDYTTNAVGTKYIQIPQEQFNIFLRYESYDSPGYSHPYAWVNELGNTYYTDTENPTTSDYAYATNSTSTTTQIVNVGVETQRSETICSYTITYVLAEDGHKITTDESTVANIYNETGVAWYYVLDTTNQRFKLPRGSHGGIVEKYASGKDWYRVYADGWCEQGGTVSNAASSLTVSLLKTFVSTNYSLNVYKRANDNDTGGYADSHCEVNGGSPYDYGQSTTGFRCSTASSAAEFTWEASGYVSSHPENSQYKYLYFYIGEYSQSATEQTAGLNSSLFNGKLDLDMANMNPTSDVKKTFVRWGVPDYDSGVSITSPYTPSVDGIITAQRSAGYSTAEIKITDTGVVIARHASADSSSSNSTIWAIVKAGVSYTLTAGTNTFYPFIGA